MSTREQSRIRGMRTSWNPLKANFAERLFHALGWIGERREGRNLISPGPRLFLRRWWVSALF
jgi:hypothetical protein